MLYFNKAIKSHAEGDIQQAKLLYLKSIANGFENEDLYTNLGIICKNEGDFNESGRCYRHVLRINPFSCDAYTNLSSLAIAKNEFTSALDLANKAINLNPNCNVANLNAGAALLELGDLEQALASTLKSLEIKLDNPTAHMNLGRIYKDLGNLDQALTSTLKSLELKPDNPTALINLGGIYKDLGNLDQALTSTLKSLELKPDNSTALLNLSGIYKDLGNLDQALASTLKSLKRKPGSPGSFHHLNGVFSELTLSASNAHILTQAFEIMLNLKNILHSKLSTIFIHLFLPAIQAASKSNHIISDNSDALNNLAADWRLRKSLTLFVAPHQDFEHFLTRLRKELLIFTSQEESIPEYLKPLTEAMATQCFLNEYVYAQSPAEEELVNRLIQNSSKRQDSFNQHLAIIACYIPIHKLKLNQEWLKYYPTTSEESKTLIQIQLEEPKEEERIKASIQSSSTIDDEVSSKVKEMYEENPYPRYRYADHTDKSLAKPPSEVIKLESTKCNLQFSEELTTNNSCTKVLIAGCGTGNQVINASRYLNAQITAIDLSRASLAYAIRKTKSYEMNNISFKMMDILEVANLDEQFATIECSGVLHHMKAPAEGLSALNEKLKPGGYIKLGLYSEIARQQIVEARNQIKRIGFKSTADEIRAFRQQVLHGEFQKLTNLPSLGRDFYSLSECRDLCFHVQEHRFTTESLKTLLDTHRLTFCGFMLPAIIRKSYQEQSPDDSEMTSLEKWGEFEKKHPTTFRSMYQFWAYKPS